MATVPCGFHAGRWARAFTASTHEMLGAETTPSTFVAPLGPDPDALASIAATPDVDAAGRELDEVIGDRLMLLRVDRVEPSKNIVRGFAAFDLLLETEPATLAPRASALAFASLRVIFSSVPVNTTVLSAIGEPAAAGAAKGSAST